MIDRLLITMILAIGSLAASAESMAQSSDSFPATEPEPATQSVSESESESESEPPPPDRRSYSIRVWFSIDPAARLAKDRRDALIRDWQVLTHRFVGAPWTIQVVEGTGPLLGFDPENLKVESVAPAVEGANKGWFFRIEPADTGAGYRLLGREYDALIRQLGPLYQQPAPFPRDTPRSLFELSRRVFAPVAEIERTEDGANLVVQGASLPVSDPVGRVVDPGTVFRPYWIFQTPDDTIRDIRAIPFTYLRVEEIEESTARCRVVSGLRQPLPRQVSGRYRLVALGLKPADVPTRFRFLASTDENTRPVAGYVLTARGLNDTAAEPVGTTDREGRITLPPQFDDELVILRLMAAGVEPLREFPVLPGETSEEREVPVEPKPEAVALEFRLRSLQDEIVDLIARRGRLEALLDARSEGQAWNEVKTLLDEYRQLTTRREMEDRLNRLKQQAQRQQAELGVPILTRTALAELAETEALIERYLDDEAFRAFADAYQRAQEQKQVADRSKGEAVAEPSALGLRRRTGPVARANKASAPQPKTQPSEPPAQPQTTPKAKPDRSGRAKLVPF